MAVLEKYKTLELLKPECSIEESIMNEEVFVQSIWWGFPRYGHPEGRIIYHIQEVLKNINDLTISAEERKKLRLTALLHDAFKYQEYMHRQLKDPAFSHPKLARLFAEKFISDPSTLKLIEWHDEAYFCWRMIYLFHQKEAGKLRLERFLQLFKNEIESYYLFFRCDTQTGDTKSSSINLV